MIIVGIVAFAIGLCSGVMCYALCKSADAGDRLPRPINNGERRNKR